MPWHFRNYIHEVLYPWLAYIATLFKAWTPISYSHNINSNPKFAQKHVLLIKLMLMEAVFFRKMVIKRHGRNWRVAKSCDLQSQSPFVRCQDKKCNIGHSVQPDQNDENLSSSQFMSRIEQSVFPTTLLQLKTLPEIWFPTDWLLQIPPPCSALPRSGCGGSVYNSVYIEQ